MQIICDVIMPRLSCPPDVVPLALHQSRNVASDLLLAVPSKLHAEASVVGRAQTESPPTQSSQLQGQTVLGSWVDRQRHYLVEGGLTGQAYHHCPLPLRVRHRLGGRLGFSRALMRLRVDVEVDGKGAG